MEMLILGIVGRAEPIQANLLSPTDMLIVGIVAIMLFGNRLPSVARSLGRSLTEFKKGMQELENEVKTSTQSDAPNPSGYVDRFRSLPLPDDSISPASVAAPPNEKSQSSTAPIAGVASAQADSSETAAPRT
jgi:TatA/E family protein of Tat protein translocase